MSTIAATARATPNSCTRASRSCNRPAASSTVTTGYIDEPGEREDRRSGEREARHGLPSREEQGADRDDPGQPDRDEQPQGADAFGNRVGAIDQEVERGEADTGRDRQRQPEA